MLPIQFRTRLSKKEFGDLCSVAVLDAIQNWLEKERFNHIIRKQDKIVFHIADLWMTLNIRTFLVSGTITVKTTNDGLIITNGNWSVFLIAFPFLIAIAIAKSQFAVVDESDISMIWTFFIILFGGNLLQRIIAHFWFKRKIIKIIKSKLDIVEQ